MNHLTSWNEWQATDLDEQISRNVLEETKLQVQELQQRLSSGAVADDDEGEDEETLTNLQATLNTLQTDYDAKKANTEALKTKYDEASAKYKVECIIYS